MVAESVLDLQGLAKNFGGTRVLEEISFSVRRGEILALLGPSGCGKTTLLRMIAGFEVPDRGRIIMNGRDLTENRPYERSIGMVFQDYALFPHMTVAQNLAFGMRHRGLPKREFPVRSRNALELVGLSEFAGRRPGQLSGGQQQRVALARAIATEPEVMLLDEPLSNLDASLRLRLRIELRDLLKETLSTAIVVTHDQEEAMGLADRIVLMNAGGVVQIDAPDQLYARPSCRFAASFIGEATWFEGVVTNTETGQMLEGGFGAIPINSGTYELGMRYSLCLRPERITLLPIAAEEVFEVSTKACLFGTLIRIERLGGELRMWVRMADGQSAQVSAKNTSAMIPAEGEPVRLAFCAADGVLFPAQKENEK